MDFEVVGPFRDVENHCRRACGAAPAAVGPTIRERSLKGVANVRLLDGSVHTAEVHWYEAHGIGRREMKIKFPLLD